MTGVDKRAYTVDEMAAAIREAHGLLFPAARALKVSRQAVAQRVQKSAILQAVVAESRESIKDVAESALYASVVKRDPWAVQFILRTLARDRGYADRQEITGPEGGPIMIQPVDYRIATSPLLTEAQP